MTPTSFLKSKKTYRFRPASLLTLKEAATRSVLTVNALKKHIMKGNLKGENLEGKVWLVRWKDVERFLKVHADQLRRGSKRQFQTWIPLPPSRQEKKKAGTLL